MLPPLDPFTLRRRNRLMDPRGGMAPRQSAGAFQSALGLDDEDQDFQNPLDEFDFGTDYRGSLSDDLDGLEGAARQRGGMMYDPENMRRYLQAMTDLDQAPRPRMDQFTQHLENLPTREQYKPTKMGRLEAALVGFGTGFAEGPTRGYVLAKATLEDPYRQAREEWGDKIAPMQHAAELEQRDYATRMAGLQRGMATGVNMQRAATAAANQESLAAQRRKSIENIDSQIAERKKVKPVGGTVVDAQGNVHQRMSDGSDMVLPYKSMQWATFTEKQRQDAIDNANAKVGLDLEARRTAVAEGQLDIAGQRAASADRDTFMNNADRILKGRALAAEELRSNERYAAYFGVDPATNRMGLLPFDASTMNDMMYDMLRRELERRAALYSSGQTDPSIQLPSPTGTTRTRIPRTVNPRVP